MIVLLLLAYRLLCSGLQNGDVSPAPVYHVASVNPRYVAAVRLLGDSVFPMQMA